MTPDRTGFPPAEGPLALHFGSNLSSFSEHLRLHAPELLPGNRFEARSGDVMVGADFAPHGTTIVALTYAGGVLLAGDRRATQGNLIANKDIQKLYVTDEYSAAGIAGTAGIAIELVRLFAVELEHYEKIEGISLTFDGKASKLSGMVRGNLPAAMQGLAAIPLLVGYDTAAADPAKAGRIVSYDVVGGRSEERSGYHAVGSGSLFAKSAIKKLYRDGLDEAEALRIAIESLYDAADDDSATGGPDLARRIYPSAVTITVDGAVEVPATRTEEIARAVVADRTEQGGAPR
ncbi:MULTISPECIES: proteasome subunit beta [Antrihabitans]|uniref:Proteasome subunit beta n=1 Tax=Antrihabitans spumae TaxID=3373370 RepID=A0ABW7K0X6_9NOCA|nr:proteasome subunit beta [Antrihabitans stalagmiti]